MKRAIPLAMMLAACGQQTDSPPANGAADAPPTADKAAPVLLQAFVHDEKNEVYEYHFGWSAEAAAVPQLVARFKVEMQKAMVDLYKAAQREIPSNPYTTSTNYKTAGQSTRLLSLSVDAAAYTGGAHGNYGTGGLLWDRQAAREIAIADLFAEAANRNQLLTQRWCDALNKAREEKRGEPVGEGGMFDECPRLDEIAIVPTDKDKNGRFERLMLTASPYVAGPYAEGSYEIELSVTPDLVAAIKDDYRTSFEVGQTQ